MKKAHKYDTVIYNDYILSMLYYIIMYNNTISKL